MKQKVSIKTNRIISIFSLCIFIFSIGLLLVVSINVYNAYTKNQALESEKQAVVLEQEHLKNLSDKLANDATYYSVFYHNGNSYIFDNGNVVIIFS